MPRFYWASLLLAALLPLIASAQQRRDVVVIYKDGFHFKGKVEEGIREVIYDSKSGKAFPIPSGQFSIDDHVRKIMFSPTHVKEVIQLKQGAVKEPMLIKRFNSYYQSRDLLEAFKYERFSEWGENCERTVDVFNDGRKKGYIKMTQKIGLLTPQYIVAITEDYRWNLVYATQEFGPEKSRKMLWHIFNEKKDLKALPEGQKYLEIARFMTEAGWFKEAEEELVGVTKNYPAQKKVAEELLATMRKDRADMFVESIKRARDVGQHKEALERLDEYARQGYSKIAAPKSVNLADDLKADYDKDKTRLEQARQFLKDIPEHVKKQKPRWVKAAELILDELNYDTVDRLDEFLQQAAQFERQRKEKLPLTHSAEEVLAFGVSGFLQGKLAFDKEPAVALKLIDAREFLLAYLRADGELTRARLLAAFRSGNTNDLPFDMLVRLVRMIPPPDAHPAKEINTEVQTINIQSGDGGTYLLQLPPNYHHQRAYPVLLVLDSSRFAAEEMLKRCSEEAAKHGFILAAPQWSTKKGLGTGKWQYSARERGVVLDTLRDLRRRFQVDSDRVFLFGWEDGANGAFDVALAHPDQFAGVVPMCGGLTPFARRFYWTNAQYLPFYVIDGERSGRAKAMQELFKEWTRSPFASLYLEYKGRGSEFFVAEIPPMFDWMSRKRRYQPVKEMGQASFGTGLGVEFRSSRSDDNRFYWLSAGDIVASLLRDHTDIRWAGTYRPATFQATLSVGNRAKTGGKESDIWNDLNVRVRGVRSVTFWVAHDMLKLEYPLIVRMDGVQVGPKRTIVPSLDVMLQQLQESGDRQRLYVAKVDITK